MKKLKSIIRALTIWAWRDTIAENKKLVGFYNEIVSEVGHDRIIKEYRVRGVLLADECNRRKDAEELLNGLEVDRFKGSIYAIEVNARANEEAASRATEARDIAWSQGVAAGLRLALSYLPNAQEQTTARTAPAQKPED